MIGTTVNEQPASSSTDPTPTNPPRTNDQTTYEPGTDEWTNIMKSIEKHWNAIFKNGGHFIWRNPGTGGKFPGIAGRNPEKYQLWKWYGNITDTLQMKCNARADMFRGVDKDDFYNLVWNSMYIWYMTKTPFLIKPGNPGIRLHRQFLLMFLIYIYDIYI